MIALGSWKCWLGSRKSGNADRKRKLEKEQCSCKAICGYKNITGRHIKTALLECSIKGVEEFIKRCEHTNIGIAETCPVIKGCRDFIKEQNIRSRIERCMGCDYKDWLVKLKEKLDNGSESIEKIKAYVKECKELDLNGFDCQRAWLIEGYIKEYEARKITVETFTKEYWKKASCIK